MNIRTAKKILKYKDSLKYTKNQIDKAETINRRYVKNQKEGETKKDSEEASA